jgi:glycosyltransferase involved in cell wall biosynthesis
MPERRPTIELFAGLAAGAVVHARHYADRVAAVCPGPVSVLPLAYPLLAELPAPPAHDGLTIATIGEINANSRPDEVLYAIAAEPTLRKNCKYRLIGAVEEQEQLRLVDLAMRLGLAPPEFAGWGLDDVLASALADVDVIACLGSPVPEGGSASMAVAMSSGRPVLVSAHGIHAEVPDDLVLRCAPGAEANDLRRHLLMLLATPGAGHDMGRRAAEFARINHAAAPYVTELLNLIEQAVDLSPMLRTAQALGAELADLGVPRGHPVQKNLVSELAKMFEPTQVSHGPVFLRKPPAALADF